MSFIVGLTGGIGSGKSAAADYFAARGAAIVDTDAISHTLTAPGGAAIEALRAAFGNAVINAAGALDRAVMRRIVFAEPEERARLEAILHPLIRAESERQIRRAAGADFVVVVVPLLAETGGWRERVDRVLVVDCPEETQIARVMARSGLTRAEVEAILAAQSTRQARLAIADDVIENDAGLDHLERQVDALHARYREMARQRHDSHAK